MSYGTLPTWLAPEAATVQLPTLAGNTRRSGVDPYRTPGPRPWSNYDECLAMLPEHGAAVTRGELVNLFQATGIHRSSAHAVVSRMVSTGVLVYCGGRLKLPAWEGRRAPSKTEARRIRRGWDDAEDRQTEEREQDPGD